MPALRHVSERLGLCVRDPDQYARRVGLAGVQRLKDVGVGIVVARRRDRVAVRVPNWPAERFPHGLGDPCRDRVFEQVGLFVDRLPWEVQRVHQKAFDDAVTADHRPRASRDPRG